MNWKGICIHHSASKDGTLRDWDTIKKWHLARGWRDIGYHFGIEALGDKYTVQEGRPLNMSGAHCPAVNSSRIGICVVGNFEVDVPHPQAILRLAELCASLCNQFKFPAQMINCHRDFAATLCPGKHMPMQYIVELTKYFMDVGR